MKILKKIRQKIQNFKIKYKQYFCKHDFDIFVYNPIYYNYSKLNMAYVVECPFCKKLISKKVSEFRIDNISKNEYIFEIVQTERGLK